MIFNIMMDILEIYTDKKMSFIINLFLKVYCFMYLTLFQKARSFLRDTRGVTAIEYALIAVAISAMLFIVLGSGDDGLISKIKNSFKGIQDALTVTKDQSGQK